MCIFRRDYLVTVVTHTVYASARVQGFSLIHQRVKRGPCGTTGVKSGDLKNFQEVWKKHFKLFEMCYINWITVGRCHLKTIHDFLYHFYKWEKQSINPHVVIMSSWPFLRTLVICLERDLSHMSTYLRHGAPSSHGRLSAGHPRHQYESFNIENGAWINARRTQTSHHRKIKSIHLREEICSRIMGWSTFIDW